MSSSFPILYIAETDAEAAVLSSGALACLVDSLPQAAFTVVGSAASAPLFADTPRLARLIVMDGNGRFEWIALWNQVRQTRWGLVVDQRSTRFSERLRRQKRAVKGPPRPGVHAVEDAAYALHLDDIPAPRLFVGDETRAAADALIGDDPAPILAVGPGADWIGKRWPAERYSKVAAPLLADDGPLAGGRLMIVGEEADRDLAHTIRLAVPRARVIELQGKLTRLQTAAALSHATLYIGADSIWTQLAVAARVPTIGVYGPSDDSHVGPWGGVSIRGERSFEEFRAVDPNLNQAIQHMMGLPAERVLKAAWTLLEKNRAAQSGTA